MDTEALMNRLTFHIVMLERCNKDWTEITKDLKAKWKLPMKRNMRVLLKDEGFIKAIIAGNEVVARLKARIAFVSRKRNKVNLKEASLSLTQLTPQPLDASLLADTAMCLPKLHLQTLMEIF